MPKPGQITRSQAVDQVAAQLTGPISFDEFAERVLAIAPSTAKNPRASVRTDIRFNTIERGLIFMDNRRSWLMPAQVGMRGVRFRHTISQWEAENSVIILDDELLPFLPVRRYQLEQAVKGELSLRDDTNAPLAFAVMDKRFDGKDPIFGDYSVSRLCLDLQSWFQGKKISEGDSLLFTIEQWKPSIWKIEHEPAAMRNQAAIDQRNEELVDILFEMLESEQNERLYLGDSLLTAMLQLADPQGYPGDPWTLVVQEDGRMHYSDFDLRYADGKGNIFEELARSFAQGEEEDEELDEPRELSQEEANQVYRFKTWDTHNTKLWRRIEILGEQTLADFNHILVSAYKHEWDHLAGFWKLVQRGNSKRYREVDIGEVNPFDEGEGADTRIADLELKEGDLLKYVFDFGDWHDHRLQLEKILPAVQMDQAAEYPRIVEQNKPEYQYCQQCQKKNKQVIATWICIECSNEKQQKVFVCEKCATRYHEDHYTEEIVY